MGASPQRRPPDAGGPLAGSIPANPLCPPSCERVTDPPLNEWELEGALREALWITRELRGDDAVELRARLPEFRRRLRRLSAAQVTMITEAFAKAAVERRRRREAGR
jgi:hypothetical protein